MQQCSVYLLTLRSDYGCSQVSYTVARLCCKCILCVMARVMLYMVV